MTNTKRSTKRPKKSITRQYIAQLEKKLRKYDATFDAAYEEQGRLMDECRELKGTVETLETLYESEVARADRNAFTLTEVWEQLRAKAMLFTLDPALAKRLQSVALHRHASLRALGYATAERRQEIRRRAKLPEVR